jgi:DNA-binding transcriptional ArsR family regulator
MNKKTFENFFFAIGDANRFSILMRLSEKDLCVGEIVKLTAIEQSNVSHHLACLSNCGLVSARKDGKKRVYTIKKEAKPIIRGIIRHIERFDSDIKSCDIANKVHGRDNGEI